MRLGERKWLSGLTGVLGPILVHLDHIKTGLVPMEGLNDNHLNRGHEKQVLIAAYVIISRDKAQFEDLCKKIKKKKKKTNKFWIISYNMVDKYINKFFIDNLSMKRL